MNKQFLPDRTFDAWNTSRGGTALLEAGGLLVGIEEEEGSRYPLLKVWDLTRDEKKKGGVPGQPVLLRSVRIQHGQRPHPVSTVYAVFSAVNSYQVSAIALTSNLSHLAIGLGDGTVLLYRHLLQSLTTSPTSLTSLPKARVLHVSPEPITGLGFREPTKSASRAPVSDKPNDTAVSLFIVTTNRVLCAPVSGKGGEARTIDELGCGLGCAVMDWDKREMIVARDEAIYLYGPEGRGACYAYEGLCGYIHSNSTDLSRSKAIDSSLPEQPDYRFSPIPTNGNFGISNRAALRFENKYQWRIQRSRGHRKDYSL
jgi:hypothetical protein